MLEEKIDELTAAVKELTAVMSAGAAPKKTRKTKTKPEEVKEEPETTCALPAEEKPEPEIKNDNFPATLDDVKKAIIEVAKIPNGRDIAVAVLEEFGAKKATELKEDDYFMVIKTLKEGLKGEAGDG